MKKQMETVEEISAIEAARKLGVGLDYLYGLQWVGALEARKVGKRWCVSMEAVEKRLRARGER